MGPSEIVELKRQWGAKNLHEHCHIFGDGFDDWVIIRLSTRPSVKLSQGWSKKLTCDHVPYYYHTVTGELTWNTPEALRASTGLTSSGEYEWFWVPDVEEGWLAARSLGGGGQYETRRGDVVTVRAGGALPLTYSALARLQPDLVLLDSLDEGLVLHNLRERFGRDEIYTAVGSIIIAFNPFRRLPLYGTERIEAYAKAGNKPMPPHPYKLAAAAHRALLEEGVDQAILVSGESGAGKTEATKQCLSYLAEVAGSNTTNIEQRVLSANPMLEAFGNAKTTRNDNSSRFGRFTEVQMDPQLRIAGARLTNYLLEKSRVQGQSVDERNYHAFYQVCAAEAASPSPRYGLGPASDYEYLTKCLTVPSIDDRGDFDDVVQAMETLAFEASARDQIFQILAAILKVGTVGFVAVTGLSDGSDVFGPSRPSLGEVAAHLGVDGETLREALTHRTLQIRGQANMAVSLRVEQAMENRDALAKYVYDTLFNWLVARVNAALEAPAADVKCFIGILDIFGFEIFEMNSFEQLCINFTNEKLQQLFNEHTFKTEEAAYALEGVAFPPIVFIDNQPIVDLIEKKGGILTVLDDTVKGPGKPEQKDAKFSQTMDSTQGGGRNAFYVAANEHRGVRGAVFSVRHYAGTVCYSCAGFVEKNADTLYKDLYDCMSESASPLVAAMFPRGTEEEAHQNHHHQKKETLGAAFRKQLSALMAKLRQTAPHYIRCVKPNQVKATRRCDGAAVLEQLRCAGVFESVKIRKQGFPFRFDYDRFVARYKSIMSTDAGWIPLKGPTARARCEEILATSRQTFEKLQRGRTQLLFRADEYRVLELCRALAADRVSAKIEAIGRGNLTRRYLARMHEVRPLLRNACKSGDPEELEVALRLTDEALGVFASFEVAVPIPEWAEARRLVKFVKEANRLSAMLEVVVAAAGASDVELVADGDRFEALFRCLRVDCAVLATHIPVAPLFDQWYAYADALLTRALEGRFAPRFKKVMDSLERDDMLDLYADAVKYGYETPFLKDIEELAHCDSETLLKRQYQKALETGQAARAIAKEIELKEMYLDQYAAMFVFANAACLRHVDEYAAAATLWTKLKKERVQTMLDYSKLKLLTSLTRLDARLTKEALRVNKSIMGYMGEVRTYASDDLCVEVVQVGLFQSEMRPEIYAQLIKQLTGNPHPDSARRGWALMLMCLAHFPPEAEIENYLHIFIRTHAPTDLRAALVDEAHRITYAEALKREAPDVDELQAIVDRALGLRGGGRENKAMPPNPRRRNSFNR